MPSDHLPEISDEYFENTPQTTHTYTKGKDEIKLLLCVTHGVTNVTLFFFFFFYNGIGKWCDNSNFWSSFNFIIVCAYTELFIFS